MQSLVRVLRKPYRSRYEIKNFTGRIDLIITTCSKSEDDFVDSFLFVGSGNTAVMIPPKHIEEEGFEAKSLTYPIFERVVDDLAQSILPDYEGFMMVGGKPTIPGSSVKGNVRSRLELSFKPKNGFIRSCLIKAINELIEEPEVGKHGWRHFRIWHETLSFIRENACEYSEEEVCLTCDLFGTMGLKGIVEFSDFTGENVKLELVELPFSIKVLAAPPGSSFKGHISFQSLEVSELGLLLYAMGIRDKTTGKPVLLGKFKYRVMENLRFGVVKYKVERLVLSPFSSILEVNDLKVSPGSIVTGSMLDTLVRHIVNIAKNRFSDELLDVDEVKAVENLPGN